LSEVASFPHNTFCHPFIIKQERAAQKKIDIDQIKIVPFKMTFPIIIKHERKTIRLQVEKIEETETTEKFRVIANNQSFVLQNNRPVILAKRLKYFPIKWKVVQGGYNHQYILDLITKEIEKKLR
jgi:hypothetical protein